MLSFSITDDSKSIQIYCDRSGLDGLIAELESLRSDKAGHIHLSLSLGGSLLNDKTPFGEQAVAEVIVTTGPTIK